MHLTDRLTRMLLGTMTLGAVLVPATMAAAEPPGGPGDLTTPTTDPCGPDGCLPPEPEPECPPFVANCDELTSDPCNPVEEDCSPDTDPDPEVEPDPEPEPEPQVDPDPETVDPSVPADPNFTG